MGNFSRAAVLGAGVLAAGFATALPAGTAAASPAAASGTTYDLEAGASVNAVGHSWDLNIGATKSGVVAALIQADNQSASEFHGWSSSQSFAPLAARDLAVTSGGHATFKTGSALSPVLAVSLAFTPVKAQRDSCARGSSTTYTGYMTGTAALATGLHGVTVSVPFSQKSGPAALTVDNSCVPPASKLPCAGGIWNIGSASPPEGAIGAQTLGTSPSWGASLARGQVKTASRYLVRSDQVITSGGEPAPRLDTAARTVAVTTSGVITGSAVISYSSTSRQSTATCVVGSKQYTETGVQYTGSARTTRPFQAHTILTGTLSVTPGNHGSYTEVRLTAK